MPSGGQQARPPDHLDILLAPLNPGAPDPDAGRRQAVDVAEEGNLPCVLPLSFFLIIAGVVGMALQWKTTGAIDAAVAIIYFSIIAVFALGVRPRFF